MGLVSTVKDMQKKFEDASTKEEKQTVLLGFKEFCLVEQGLSDLPKKDREAVWEMSRNDDDFYETFIDMGTNGRKLKDGDLDNEFM